MKIIGLFLFILANFGTFHAAEPMMQTLTGETTLSCPQDNTLTLQGSELGFNYYLRNEADDAIAAGPVAGTGAALNFQTGVVSETSSYYVSATNQSYALDFDGVNDTVSIPHGDHLKFSTGLTIEGWINVEDLTTSGGIQKIYRKENFGQGCIVLSFLKVGSQHILSFGVHTDDNVGYIELNVDIDKADYENQWVHIMATFNNNVDLIENMSLFRNGVQIGGMPKDGEIITPPFPSGAYIGSLEGNGEFFNGKMASLRIWDKALTSLAEIDAAMANDINGDEPGMVAYYAFDEGAGNTLNDNALDDQSMPYNNHGAIIDATWQEVIIGNEEEFTVSNTQTITVTPETDMLYVDQNATGNNDGTSWEDAFITIQPAVTAAVENQEIRIAQGTYVNTSQITVTKALNIKGGYVTGGSCTQDIANSPTIINANFTDRVLSATHSTGTLYLEGLTFKNGARISNSSDFGGGIWTSGDLNLNQVEVSNNRSRGKGGGIYTENGNITLTNSKINNNLILYDSSSYGGGIYSENGNIFLSDSQIANNLVTSSYQIASFKRGGGIYLGSGSITLINSQINNNSLTSDSESNLSISLGAGIFGTSITLINSHVTNNNISASTSNSINETATASSSGGGIYGTTVSLVNSLVASNTISSSASSSSSESFSFGGGIFGTTITLTNSKIINNTISTFSGSSGFSISRGGGVYGTTNLQNSILWSNKEYEEIGGVVQIDGFNEHEVGALTANYSLIKNQNPAGTNNIDATMMGFDPMFENEASGDFRLLVGSPLIDSGDFNLLPLDDYDIDQDSDLTERIPLDLDGITRASGMNVDIGAYEYQSASEGVALNVSISRFQVTFDYYLEHLSSIDLQNLTLAHDLDAVFGAGNYSINSALSFVDDPSTVNLNVGFNGASNTAILDANTTLTGLDTAQIRLVVDVNTLINSGNYNTQVTFNAQDTDMNMVSDLSDFGVEPDANSNNNANETGENYATIFSIMTTPAIFSMNYSPDSIAVNNNSTLTYTIDNSAGTTASNLAFSQTLPSGLVVADTANTINNCGGTFTASGTTISLSTGNVNAASTCTISLDITGTQGGTFNTTTGDLTSTAGNSGTANVTLTVDGAPTITLLGNPTINLTVGDSYSDAGATASDVEDGDLTSSILVTGLVDVNTANTYLIKYNVQDSAGNDAIEVTRTVIVSEPENYFVGGTVDGLFDGNFFVLKLNNAEEKIISQNGGYIFKTPLVEDDTYSVSMDLDPNNPIQPCDLSGEDGTINTEDIMNVDVMCTAGDDLIYRDGFEN